MPPAMNSKILISRFESTCQLSLDKRGFFDEIRFVWRKRFPKVIKGCDPFEFDELSKSALKVAHEFSHPLDFSGC